MTKKFAHGGTFTDDEGIIHSFGCKASTKCGLAVKDPTHGAYPDSVTCRECIATFPEWLLACIRNPLVWTKEGYYVHWRYVRWSDTGKLRDKKSEEHVAAEPPHYYYDREHKKWALTFLAADGGGHDVQNFTFYFGSEEDILKYLKKKTYRRQVD